MYERLTSSILDKAIPSKAGLRVVSGFVENGSGVQSGQIDCLLVFGEGTPLPYSKHSKWHVRDVVAVLEVKKRLFSRELADAQEQLRDVLDIYGSYVVRDATEFFNIEPSLFAFGTITGVVPPMHDEASRLPFHLEMLYRTLIVEQISPSGSSWAMGVTRPSFLSGRLSSGSLKEQVRVSQIACDCSRTGGSKGVSLRMRMSYDSALHPIEALAHAAARSGSPRSF
jgi:hypothetical protein